MVWYGIAPPAPPARTSPSAASLARRCEARTPMRRARVLTITAPLLHLDDAVQARAAALQQGAGRGGGARVASGGRASHPPRRPRTLHLRFGRCSTRGG